MADTRLHLIRHGQVEGFEQKRYNGQGDVALTETGLRQYQGLRERLRTVPLRAVYTSDLRRCAVGAALIAEPHGLCPVALPELRELHAGRWEGLPWQEVIRQDPDLWQERLRDIVNVAPPGGESVAQVAARVLPAVRALVARHPGEDILVVGHGGVNRILLLDALGAPLARVFHLEQEYGCYNRVLYRADGSTVLQVVNA